MNITSQNENLIELYDHCHFIKDIIDGMFDWVRVLDKDDNIIYVNKAMADGLGCYPIGKKCFNILGRAEPCENCIARKTVFDGYPHEKEEVINGRTFSVMSSPVKNDSGKIIAVVEVLRDVTHMKQLHHRKFFGKMKSFRMT